MLFTEMCQYQYQYECAMSLIDSDLPKKPNQSKYWQTGSNFVWNRIKSVRWFHIFGMPKVGNFDSLMRNQRFQIYLDLFDPIRFPAIWGQCEHIVYIATSTQINQINTNMTVTYNIVV